MIMRVAEYLHIVGQGCAWHHGGARPNYAPGPDAHPPQQQHALLHIVPRYGGALVDEGVVPDVDEVKVVQNVAWRDPMRGRCRQVG